MLRAFCAALAFLVATSAQAQFRPIESFSYGSSGCETDQFGTLFRFTDPRNGAKSFMMGWVQAGGGILPPSGQPFWVRGIHVSLIGAQDPNTRVMIGHGGSDYYADPVTGFTVESHIMFPTDAAILFQPGDYLDAHVTACDGYLYVTVWWTAYTTGPIKPPLQ